MGFIACRFKIPFTVKSLGELIPPVPTRVMLLTFVEKNEDGRVIASLLVNIKVAALLLTSKLPVIRVGELPVNVNVLAATDKIPDERFNRPFIVMLWFPNVTPPERLMVRFVIVGAVENKFEGNVIASVPPKLNEDVGSI